MGLSQRVDLHVDTLRLAPLRERREDIALLIRHILVLRAQADEAFRKRFFRKGIDGRLEPNVSDRLVDELVRHLLPTNVRQLEILLNEAIEFSEAREGNELRLPKGGFEASAVAQRDEDVRARRISAL